MSSSFEEGTEAVLGAHRGQAANTSVGQRNKHPGDRETEKFSMMHYCNADMELPLEKHFDILHGQLDDEHEIMALANSTGDDSKKSYNSSTSESQYRPLPSMQPERSRSLLEDRLSRSKDSSAGSACTESVRTDKTILIEERAPNKPTYHPALRAAVCAEGQEVMWHEDEYSTVSSIMVQPTKAHEQPKQPDPTKAHPRHRIPFFHRNKKDKTSKTTNEGSIQSAPSDPVKVHVKRKKVKKSVVLLPQEDNPGFANLQHSSDAQEQAIENMVKARELLNKALVLEEKPRLDDSEKMARIAFAHAAAARRLASDLGSNENEEQNDEKTKELESVLHYLSEQGQEAVYQHQQFIFSRDEGDDEDESDDDDDTPKSLREPGKKTKLKRARGLGEYAVRAVHYLESMLPKNLGEHSIDDTADMVRKTLSGDDFWSDAGISTLGMKNDTFEYGFSCGNNILPQVSTSHHNMDLMSLSSLNEILDGPMEEEDSPQQNGQDTTKNEGESPRAALPVIDVPQRKPRQSRHRAPKPSKILGLVTPSSKRIKNLLTPRKNKSIDASDVVSAKSVISKHAKEKRNERTIYEEREYEPSDVDSQAACGDEDSLQSPAIPKQNVDPKQPHILHKDKSDSSDSISGPRQERYKQNEIAKTDLTLLTSASFKEPDLDSSNSTQLEEQEVEWDDSVYQRNILELKSMTMNEKDASNKIHAKTTSDISTAGAVGGDEETDWDESIHPFLSTENASGKQITEPIGTTPRRDHDDVEMSLSRMNSHSNEGNSRLDGGHLKLTPSGDVSAVLDFDMGDVTKENLKSKNPEAIKTAKKSRVLVNHISPALVKEKQGHRKILSPSNRSFSEKSEGVKSEGSKTKIFGRIVDIMGHKKRDPLVPTAVVEETYVVTESLKKVISNGIPGVDTRENETSTVTAKAHEQTKKEPPTHLKKEKKALGTAVESNSKYAGKIIATRTKKTCGLGSNGTVFDDDTQTIEKAVSNGNMRASKSNEEEDDAPPNYLAMMLRKRAKEERQKSRDNHQDGSVTSQKMQPEDADSYVAAIRGPRHQECPGVALEGIANRNSMRDPDMSDNGTGKHELRNNLAPTPRRPVRAKSIEGLEPTNDHDPPLNDERERQRMITARLYAAGSSDSNDFSNHKALDSSKNGVEDHDDFLHTVPTVDSAASYEDEHHNEAPDDTKTGVQPHAANMDLSAIEEHSQHETKKHARKDRKSFLPNILKMKI